MKKIDKEAMELIEELCRKEVERTGLPLVLDKDIISVEDDTTYFHQRMRLAVDGYDIVYVENQYDIELVDGKWTTHYSDDKFYGYELFVSRNNHSLTISLDKDSPLTQDEISKKLSSDDFKKMFSIEEELSEELWKIKREITFFVRG